MKARILPASLIAAGFALGCINIQRVLPEPTEWKEIFREDGIGWIQRGGHALFQFRWGEMVAVTKPNEPASYMCTVEEFADFEMEFDFKVNSGLNSGIQLRSHAHEDGSVYGYRVELDRSPESRTGGIYEEGGRGWLDNLHGRLEAREAFRYTDWNHMRVIALKNHMQTWVNGVLAGDLYDSKEQSGFIALEVHQSSDRTDPREVRWKNFRIRKLPPELAPPPKVAPVGMP